MISATERRMWWAIGIAYFAAFLFSGCASAPQAAVAECVPAVDYVVITHGCGANTHCRECTTERADGAPGPSTPVEGCWAPGSMTELCVADCVDCPAE